MSRYAILLLCAGMLWFGHWRPSDAVATPPIMCSPYEVTMKFSGRFGRRSVEEMTLIILDNNIRKCATFDPKQEPPDYEMVIGFRGREYPVPDYCIMDFVFNYNTTFADPTRKGQTILLRGESYPDGLYEERLFWVSMIEGETEFQTGHRYKIRCSHWCKGDECLSME